ncbi:aromatic prenyltransferase [Streptomyces sp. NPDC127190]|uniref:aromatic prenyltransferase n=1 Tax=unclassified Streptomyces TaxID=2593676 RepID=UPI003636EE30
MDASLSGSVDKLWLLFDHGIPLADALALPHMPEAARAAQDHFDRVGMDRIGLIALNFAHRALNIGVARFHFSTVRAPREGRRQRA